MVGQPEVVVRAEQQDRPAVEQDPRALRPADQPQPPPQPVALELIEPIAEIGQAASG